MAAAIPKSCACLPTLESIEYHLSMLNLKIFLCLYKEYGKVRRQKNQLSGSGESGQVHGTEGKGLGHSQISQIWSMGEGAVTNGVYPQFLVWRYTILPTPFGSKIMVCLLWFSAPLSTLNWRLGLFFSISLFCTIRSCLFLCPGHTDLAIVTSQYVLKPRSVMPPVLFFSHQDRSDYSWKFVILHKCLDFFYLSSEVYLIETVLIHISHWVTWVS